MTSSVTHLPPSGAIAVSNQPKPTYLPVYIERSGSRAEKATKETSLWYELGGNNPRIAIEMQEDKIVVSPSRHGLSLYAPKNISEKIEGKCGELALGVFPICENEKGELLLIKKIRGGVWYVPGGLVDSTDKTLWATAVRELKEETGLQLDEQVESKRLYAYESVTPSRHNLMLFYSAKYQGCASPIAGDSDEIEASEWFEPAIFWSSYLKGECKSLSSIQLVFQHYLESKFSRLDSDLKSEYARWKKHMVGSIDNTLFDLCFLQLEGRLTGAFEMTSLVSETKKMAEKLMNSTH